MSLANVSSRARTGAARCLCPGRRRPAVGATRCCRRRSPNSTTCRPVRLGSADLRHAATDQMASPGEPVREHRAGPRSWCRHAVDLYVRPRGRRDASPSCTKKSRLETREHRDQPRRPSLWFANIGRASERKRREPSFSSTACGDRSDVVPRPTLASSSTESLSGALAEAWPRPAKRALRSAASWPPVSKPPKFLTRTLVWAAVGRRRPLRENFAVPGR